MAKRTADREATRQLIAGLIQEARAVAGTLAGVAQQLDRSVRSLTQVRGGKNIGANLETGLRQIIAGGTAQPAPRRRTAAGTEARVRQPSGRRPAGRWNTIGEEGGRQLRSGSEKRLLSGLRGARNRGETVYLAGKGAGIAPKERYPDKRAPDRWGTGALSEEQLDDLIGRMEADGEEGLRDWLTSEGPYEELEEITSTTIRSYPS